MRASTIGLIYLMALHHSQLPKHDGPPSPCVVVRPQRKRRHRAGGGFSDVSPRNRSQCRPGTGASVAQEPESHTLLTTSSAGLTRARRKEPQSRDDETANLTSTFEEWPQRD